MKKDFKFQNWIRLFEENAAYRDSINWNEDYQLSENEKEIIYNSIRQFQRGESGEGKYLFQDAKQYVKKCTDDSYMYALQLFIHEEHRHAKYLAQFMERHGIEKEKVHWVDNVFRWLRHHGNLEVSITVLVTAELFAAIYYRALAKATKSKCLSQICERILWDEDLHINFQSCALNKIQKKRNAFLNFYMRFNHKVLLIGTIPIVWYYHKKVFKAGGFNFFTFIGETFLIYKRLHSIVTANEKELMQMEQAW